MAQNRYCVYCHTSPSGKKYIGVTCRKPEKRWNYGRGYSENEYFSRAIEKYGWSAFKHEILFEGLTGKQASKKEKELISAYETTDRSKGYNIETGGLAQEKGLSEETKRKIGEAHRGRYTQAQIEATKHRKDPHYHHSEEIKKRIGDAHRGKPLSAEHRKKLSERKMGKKPSEKNLMILREINQKAVKKYSLAGLLLGEYCSLKEAADKTGIAYQCISACCRKVAHTAGGFVWQYASEQGGAV